MSALHPGQLVARGIRPARSENRELRRRAWQLAQAAYRDIYANLLEVAAARGLAAALDWDPIEDTHGADSSS